jgi:hypothetical protein
LLLLLAPFHARRRLPLACFAPAATQEVDAFVVCSSRAFPETTTNNVSVGCRAFLFFWAIFFQDLMID